MLVFGDVSKFDIIKFKDSESSEGLDICTFSDFSPFINILNNSIFNELTEVVKYKFALVVESPVYSTDELDSPSFKVNS